MKPTQEAALRSLLDDKEYIQLKADYNKGHLSHRGWLQDRERKALTAAAEVGEWKATARNNAMQVLADRNASLIERVKKLTKDRSEIEAATIERCVEVADGYVQKTPDNTSRTMAIWIRDDIRALKDKP